MATVDSLGTFALSDGMTVVVQAGEMIVAVQRVDVGVFRMSAAYGWGGDEVAQLCRSFRTEADVRQAAGVAATLFRAGAAVPRVVEAVDALDIPHRLIEIVSRPSR
jgi:hypothetical protein